MPFAALGLGAGAYARGIVALLVVPAHRRQPQEYRDHTHNQNPPLHGECPDSSALMIARRPAAVRHTDVIFPMLENPS